MTFFAGNEKLLLVKKQVDKATPITDFATAMALRVYEFTPNPSRTQNPLSESDSSTQQGASHVAAITPGLSFGIYGRPSELDLIAEALLGANDDSSTSSPTTHTATPGNDQPYYSILEYLPYGNGRRWDGCRLLAGQFAAQDEGETELRVTGLQWEALGVTLDVAYPSPLPTPADELPFIYAEAQVSYGGVHLGTTKSFQVTVNRNGGRRQGDSGFTAIDVTPGKFQCDGQFSRYTQDDDTLREVETGSAAGTTPTTTIATESASVLFTRGASTSLRSFLIALTEVAHETREEALDLDGNPFVEVLGFRTQPQALLADHMSIVTVNAKTTP